MSIASYMKDGVIAYNVPACATLPAGRNELTLFDYFFQLFFGKLSYGSVAKPERGRASLDAHGPSAAHHAELSDVRPVATGVMLK